MMFMYLKFKGKEDSMDKTMSMTNYQFIVPMTDAEKAKYDNKRKVEGKTSQGCMRNLVLRYLKEGEHDERTDG